MKLSDRKIESLADKIVAWIEKSPDVEMLVGAATIRAAIIEEFQDEKTAERQLELDVDRILEQNETRMRLEGIDSWVMRKKIRQQLARERGIVL
jgi:hypothetical protein